LPLIIMIMAVAAYIQCHSLHIGKCYANHITKPNPNPNGNPSPTNRKHNRTIKITSLR